MYTYVVSFDGFTHYFQTDNWREISFEQQEYFRLNKFDRMNVDILSKRFLRTIQQNTIVYIRQVNNEYPYVEFDYD